MPVTRALEIKQQLVADGLVMDVDFVWRFFQSTWDIDLGSSPSYAIFEFRDPAMATFYSLKWN